MEFEAIKLEEAGGVATLMLYRPEKLNALSVAMGEEICAALESLENAPSARALVITGAGQAFSAGGDLSSMEEVVSDPAALDRGVRIYCEVARRIRELSLPVLAKVNGDVFGGALGIIMACDVRVAREEARFGFAFTRVGLSGADAGVSYLLPRLVGVGKAVELLLLGEVIGAREAERIGLINRAVAGDEVERVAAEIAGRLAAGPPIALRATKKALYEGLTRDMATDVECEASLQALCFQSGDHREGLRAFMEKRAPVFQGR